jgi:hypothetical protein
MRVECDGCHALVNAQFATEGGVVIATCDDCGKRTVVDAPRVRPAVSAKIVIWRQPRCPKCDRPRVDSDIACPGCGLSTERMANYELARDAATSPAVMAAWENAVTHWHDRAAHDALFERVTATGAYAWAAARYREAARARKSDDPVAPHALERMRRAAEATMLGAAKTTRAATNTESATPYRSTLALLGILVVALIGLLAYQLIRSQRADDPDDPPPAQVR